MAYFDNAATTFPKPVEVYEFTNKFCRNFGSSFGRSLSKEQQTVSKLGLWEEDLYLYVQILL